MRSSVRTWFNAAPLHVAKDAWEVRVLTVAASIVYSEIVASISIQGVPTARRSAPGEPPRMETHDLVRSWTYNVQPGSVAPVFSNLGYSYTLEVGNPAVFLEPRPYIARALLVREGDILDALTQPL